MKFLIFVVVASFGAKYFSKKYEIIWPLASCAMFWALLTFIFFGANIFLAPIAGIAAFWTAGQAWQGHKEEGWPWSQPL